MSLDIPRPAHAERRLTVEYVAARALAESTTLADAAMRVLQAICETLGWDYGGLWRVDDSAGVLRCTDTWHRAAIESPEFDATSRRTAFARGIGLPGRVWASGAPAWVPDVVADANFPRAAIARREGLHGAFALPLLIRGNVVGVMEFFSREFREAAKKLAEDGEKENFDAAALHWIKVTSACIACHKHVRQQRATKK